MLFRSAASRGRSIDVAIAEKAIAAAGRLPAEQRAVPEEARRHAYFGQATLRDAKDMAATDKAVAEYLAAIGLAPWWPDVYVNLSLLEESRGNYKHAESALRLYLLAAPQAPDAAAALAKIASLRDLASESPK